MGTFAEDTAIFVTHADPTTASRNLQGHLLTIQNWLQKWKINVNEIVITYNIHPQERQLSRNKHQSESYHS